jgi:7-cyano-7-deazaguanine synthase
MRRDPLRPLHILWCHQLGPVLPRPILDPIRQRRPRVIIKRGLELEVDYSQTSTCYDPAPDGLGCGKCDACQLRLKGFAENHIRDPAPYASR